ncbi:MAG: thiosulfate sulfurtransferase [Bermanella sp.]|jgi:thiosulfate sulfurtransferase
MFERISIAQAKSLIVAESCNIVDIRDAQSYADAHVPEAKHLDGNAVDEFIAASDRELPLLIYCYHGNSSQSAAQYFDGQQFKRVYSVDGGFEAWRLQL